MHYLIYKITNNLNNKIYVGKHKTEDINDEYFGSGLLLGRAVEKHGKENFKKEIIIECSSEQEMNQKEIDIVDEDFIARDDTYNIMLGGQGGWDYVNENNFNRTTIAIEKHKQSCISTQKLAVSKFVELLKTDMEFRKEFSDKQKARARLGGFSKCFLGKTHSNESKKKMSDSKKGRKRGIENPSYGKHWITNGIDNMFVKKESVPIGWKKGRV